MDFLTINSSNNLGGSMILNQNRSTFFTPMSQGGDLAPNIFQAKGNKHDMELIEKRISQYEKEYQEYQEKIHLNFNNDNLIKPEMPVFNIGISVGSPDFEGKRFDALLEFLARYKGKVKFKLFLGDSIQAHGDIAILDKNYEDGDVFKQLENEAKKRGEVWLEKYSETVNKVLNTNENEVVTIVKFSDMTLSLIKRKELDNYLYYNPLTNHDNIINKLCDIVGKKIEEIKRSQQKTEKKVESNTIKLQRLIRSLEYLLAEDKLKETFDNDEDLDAATHLLIADAINSTVLDYLWRKQRRIALQIEKGIEIITVKFKDFAEFAKLLDGNPNSLSPYKEIFKIDNTLSTDDKEAVNYVLELLSNHENRSYEWELLNAIRKKIDVRPNLPKNLTIINSIAECDNSLYGSLQKQNKPQNSKQVIEKNSIVPPLPLWLRLEAKAVAATINYLQTENVELITAANKKDHPLFGDFFIYPRKIVSSLDIPLRLFGGGYLKYIGVEVDEMFTKDLELTHKQISPPGNKKISPRTHSSIKQEVLNNKIPFEKPLKKSQVNNPGSIFTSSENSGLFDSGINFMSLSKNSREFKKLFEIYKELLKTVAVLSIDIGDYQGEIVKNLTDSIQWLLEFFNKELQPKEEVKSGNKPQFKEVNNTQYSHMDLIDSFSFLKPRKSSCGNVEKNFGSVNSPVMTEANKTTRMDNTSN